MAFENLQAFRGGFAGWENLQAFCGALRDGKTLKCFESGEVHHSATKAERHEAFCGALRDGKTLKCFESGEVHHSATKAERLKGTRRKKKTDGFGASDVGKSCLKRRAYSRTNFLVVGVSPTTEG